jgi:hypothetical protein
MLDSVTSTTVATPTEDMIARLLLLLLLAFLLASVRATGTVLGDDTTCVEPLDASCQPTLSGDVTGPYYATVLNVTIPSSNCTCSAEGTPLDVPLTIVSRDSNGAFAAGTITSYNMLSADVAFQALVVNDSVARLAVGQDGTLSFSDGINPVDVTIGRTGAQALAVNTGTLATNCAVVSGAGSVTTTTASPPATDTNDVIGSQTVLFSGNDNAFTGQFIASQAVVELNGSGDVPSPSAISAVVRVTSNRPSTHGLLEANVTDAGSGYTVGDILNVTGGGGSGGTVSVVTVDGTGAVLTIQVEHPGVGYTVGSGLNTTGGTGTGVTINLILRASTAYGTSGAAVTAVRAQAFSAAGTYSTAVVTAARAIEIVDSDLGSGPIIMTSQVGLTVDAQTQASGTTGAIDIKAQTGGAATTNFALRIAVPSGGTNNYAVLFTGNPTTAAGGLNWNTDTTLYRIGAGKLQTDGDFYSRHYICISGLPTVVAGTGAGTGSNVTVTANSNDQGVQVKVVTGTTPTASGNIFVLSFAVTFPPSSLPVVVFSPRTATAAALTGTSHPWISAEGGSSFTFSAGSTALAASTTYTWNFHVRG